MSGNIIHGNLGIEVIALKALLDSKRKTRLPRLKINTGIFDLLTYARVMEFQHYHKIKTDGIVGKNTKRKLKFETAFKAIVSEIMSPVSFTPSTVPSGSCIVIDLHGRQLMAYDSGIQKIHFNPIRGAASTRQGVFQMTNRRLEKHTSSIYPEPPGNMDYSLFFDGARAIHQGPPRERSHGCIHVGNKADYAGTSTFKTAEDLFKWAAKKNILVIVCKLPKGTA